MKNGLKDPSAISDPQFYTIVIRHTALKKFNNRGKRKLFEETETRVK